MYTALGVFNSDRRNRDGMVFPLGALAGALEQRWASGTPHYLGHDRHRLAGWSHPLGIHLQAGLARLTGVSVIAETPDEQLPLASRARKYLQEITDKHVGPHVQELQDRLGHRLTTAREWIEAGCAGVVDSGLATRIFPDIFDQRDKDGLVPLSQLNQVAPGVFEVDGLLFFAHSYFRRSLSRDNTLNEAFLARFSKLPGALNPRIALDEDMVGLASTFTGTIELEHWWGPKFNDDLSRIDAGITRHKARDDEHALHGILWTEFWWYGQGDRRTFEAEEVADLPSGGIGNTTFGCRFVHSILDEDSKTPIHLDGAGRLYDEAAMVARLDCNIYQAGRRAGYQKLWRIDGGLPVVSWKELVCHHFRDNHLVGEYLGATPPLEEEKASVFTPSSDPLEPFVPYNLRPGDGVQVHVSFHNKVGGEPGRSVLVSDVLRGDYELPFVDASVTELHKIHRRRGDSLSVPPEINRVAFEDTVINLPFVAHCGPEAVPLAARTLEAVIALCECLAGNAADRLLSFTLGVEDTDREVRFSCAGHLADLLAWSKAGLPALPQSAADVPPWLEAVYSRLNALFPGDRSPQLLHRLLQPSGALVFVRRFLPPDTLELHWDEQQQAVMFDLLVEENCPESKMLRAGELSVAPAYLIRQCRCSRCGQSYMDCPCISMMDVEVVQVIEKRQCVAAFWTNRSAGAVGSQ